MNRYLFPAIMIAMLISCRQQENKGQLSFINKSLEFSNGVIEDGSKGFIMEMEDMAKEPETSEQASRWLSVMKRIKNQADSIKLVIQNLKKEIIEQSDSLKKDYPGVIKALYEQEGRGCFLLNSIVDFKDSIPAILNVRVDNSYTGQILKTIPLLPDYLDSLEIKQRAEYVRKWLKNNFAGSTSIMAVIVLSKLENDIVTTEYELMNYCNNKIGMLDGKAMYDKFQAVAVLSSSYVKAGQQIEVTAGVGSFSEAMKPSITINGREIKLNEDAAAI
jgi:hypothetical protein